MSAGGSSARLAGADARGVRRPKVLGPQGGSKYARQLKLPSDKARRSLRRWPFPLHHPTMAIEVLFSCLECGLVYRARQSLRERGVRGADRFNCAGCGTLVHSWTGAYEFSDWAPVDLSALVPE